MPLGGPSHMGEYDTPTVIQKQHNKTLVFSYSDINFAFPVWILPCKI